ncbi:hypothetical protein QYE76_044529 [Lolium multiflorum]|uniref:Retrotransposon gag domain-containing protein n=1 Tax=Lolium multiflorum TaxID=4521 RepID=A0AAD8TL87_LOLMU|nr:hypothetical protein QYE76_044529 [Lolium multiflorum]
MITNLSPGGVGTRNASRSPAEAGTTEETITKVKVATGAGASHGKTAGNRRAEAKNLTGPLSSLPHHHQVEEVEVEAEADAEDLALAQEPLAAPRVMHGNASTSPARIWLSDLEKNSIFCWFDLKNAFEKHFKGTYKRPATASDLQACIQKKGETSRSFLTQWLQTRNECENVDNRISMHAFIGGDLAATAIPLHQQKKNRDNGSSSGTKRKYPPDDQRSGGSDLIAMAFQRGGQGGGRGSGRRGGDGRGQQRGDEVTAAGTRTPQTYEEYRDMPCLAHLDPATWKSTHTNRNCKWVNDLKSDLEAGYKRARKHRPRGKGGKGKNKDKEEDSSEAMDEDDASPDPKEGSAAKPIPSSKRVRARSTPSSEPQRSAQANQLSGS